MKLLFSSALTMLLVLCAACSSADEKVTPTPTGTPPAQRPTTAIPTAPPTSRLTATPYTGPVASATNCPFEPALCRFVVQIDDAVNAGDFGPLIARAQLRDFTCVHSGAGQPWPLCNDMPEGEIRQGFYGGQVPGEGGAYGPADFQRQLEEWKREGLRLTTVSCPPGDPDFRQCTQHFSLGFTVGDTSNSMPGRLLLGLAFVWLGGPAPTFQSLGYTSTAYAEFSRSSMTGPVPGAMNSWRWQH
jgi:hypothetical protein